MLAPCVLQQLDKMHPPARLAFRIQTLSAWSARPQQYETRVHPLRNSHHYSIYGPSAMSCPPGASAQDRADNWDKHCLVKLRLDWSQIGPRLAHGSK